MIKIYDRTIIEEIPGLFIITDASGHILIISKPAKATILRAVHSLPSLIQEIDPALKPTSEVSHRKIKIRLGRHLKFFHVYPFHVDGEGVRYIYFFQDSDLSKIMDFTTFLDFIDDSITITNRHGVVEHVNKVFREESGIDAHPGINMQTVVDIGNIEESLTLQVLKTKKTGRMNVKFKTGKTLTFTSIPFFGEDGKIEKIISTGRDVTRLIQLQKELGKAEGLKNHYYNRLSTLESLVGNNTIVHASDKMKGVISLAMKAAQSDSPVFIWGESGVGKELIANLIHKAGKSNHHPFVGINCSAVPSELMEAEFFGYEEGAFTGAKRGGKKGLFEEARNGTLFLDEITELPLSMQSKLLRVLQENVFMRVGGTKAIPLKVRIISSSNLNRERLADPETLRRDLYYRLNVIPIFVPPLRDRREDILPIVQFFLKNMNLKYNKKVKISLDILKRLNRYHWPGNIRELKNIIERLVVMTDKKEVDFEDYQAACQLETQEFPAATQGQEMFFHGNDDISTLNLMPMKAAFQKIEEILIRKAYNETGSIKKAAKVLEINPCTIHRKLKKGVIHL